MKPERRRHGQVAGEGEDLGQATDRECRRPGPSPSRVKSHPIRDQAPEDYMRRRTTQGERGWDTREMEGPTTDKPPRGRQEPGRRPRAARGVEWTWDMVAEVGTWRGAQRQATEAVGWRVWADSRWTMYHVRRGGGERVYRE